MTIDKQRNLTNDERTDCQLLLHGSQIIITRDALGVIILGILALILLMALLRSQGRNRALVALSSSAGASS